MTIVIRDFSMDIAADSHDSHRRERSRAGDGDLEIESRADRLARIRAEIERGEYETPERFEAAVERMFNSL